MATVNLLSDTISVRYKATALHQQAFPPNSKHKLYYSHSKPPDNCGNTQEQYVEYFLPYVTPCNLA